MVSCHKQEHRGLNHLWRVNAMVTISGKSFCKSLFFSNVMAWFRPHKNFFDITQWECSPILPLGILLIPFVMTGQWGMHCFNYCWETHGELNVEIQQTLPQGTQRCSSVIAETQLLDSCHFCLQLHLARTSSAKLGQMHFIHSNP